ncbi:MAG: KpsF/GutQ family sugar-phosphate isomerase [Bacteroidales bacterium]|nr:KpsF/GutQ family sugar-phosphate isomerase [Bacteroidales bacterium]MCF8328385.1 KpsF/GutQ family sugar-phosphate isomerase [Bacteroidales bacterium]
MKKTAIETIQQEANAVEGLKERVNSDFADLVKVLLKNKGRLIVTGIGKSAIIASKIVATLNSTGTPSVFMHAADAIHGDLGIIRKDDLVMCISKSGNTPEIKVLVPLIKSMGHQLVGLLGNRNSFLAKQADFILDATVEKEACPNNLAPTSSTTAQMVLGDALAVALIEARGFTQNDFAKLHPGGTLGKQMYLRVSDLYIHNEKPVVDYQDDIRKVIVEISSKRLGATAVKQDGKVIGIVTDGDLRRMLQENDDVDTLKAADILTVNPKSLQADTLAVDALDIMRKNNITQVLIMNEDEYLGMVHLHDILEAGIL